MDIFKKIASENQIELSMFKAKKPIKSPNGQEEKELVVKEDSANGQSEGTISAVQESADHTEKDGKVIQFKKAENLNEEASIKLEAQLEMAKSTLLPVFPIVRYLKNKCMADDGFAAFVIDEKKTLDKCFNYVEGEVKKALNGKNGWLDDNEVYAYAETYYMTDEAVFEKLAAEKEEEEKKRRADVEKRRKEQEEKRKKAAKEKKKNTAEAKTAAVEKVKAEAEKTESVKPEPKSKAEPEEQEKAEPVMQQQLCLDM